MKTKINIVAIAIASVSLMLGLSTTAVAQTSNTEGKTIHAVKQVHTHLEGVVAPSIESMLLAGTSTRASAATGSVTYDSQEMNQYMRALCEPINRIMKTTATCRAGFLKNLNIDNSGGGKKCTSANGIDTAVISVALRGDHFAHIDGTFVMCFQEANATEREKAGPFNSVAAHTYYFEYKDPNVPANPSINKIMQGAGPIEVVETIR
jgi:hypothetical protein